MSLISATAEHRHWFDLVDEVCESQTSSDPRPARQCRSGELASALPAPTAKAERFIDLFSPDGLGRSSVLFQALLQEDCSKEEIY